MARAMGWITAATLTAVVLGACNGGKSGPVAGTGTLPTSAGATTPGASSPPASASSVPSQTPVAVEQHPPGDIPDTSVFVTHVVASGGMSVKIPEGWAQTATGSSANFTDKLNTVNLSWLPATGPPTAASAKQKEVPMLAQTTPAFRLQSVTTALLPAGPAVLLTYEVNSAPDPVTGKVLRDTVLRYELFHNGQEKVLTLQSPVGADNVDPWRIVTTSLAWH